MSTSICPVGQNPICATSGQSICPAGTNTMCLTDNQAGLVCDITSPYLNDLCKTVCQGSNNTSCVSDCANSVCTAEMASQSITGYFWGIFKALFRINPQGWSNLPSFFKNRPQQILFIVGILIFIPMWLFYAIIFLILAATSLVSWSAMIIGWLIGLVVLLLFAGILYLYLESQLNDIENTISNVLAPYRSPNFSTQLGNQFICATYPQYPCPLSQ